MQGGKGVVTTTAKPARLQEYLGAMALQLSPAECAAIDVAGAQQPYRAHWTQCPQFDSDPRKERPSASAARGGGGGARI